MLEVEVDGETRPFRAGDKVILEPGTPHRDPWTGEGELTIRGEFTPCPPFIEAYAGALAHHMSGGTANDQDEMSLLQIFLLSKEHDGRSYRSGIPVRLQRAALPFVVPIARLRGFRGSYDE